MISHMTEIYNKYYDYKVIKLDNMFDEESNHRLIVVTIID